MRTTGVQITQLVLDQLARGEMRMLTLVVAVRRALGLANFHGDLPSTVRVALRKLVLSKAVVDDGGVFSLTPVA